MSGIYKITNIINGKCYIGQSKDIERRFAQHISESKRKRRHTALYNAFEKYGIDNFRFEVIEECCIDELDEKEIFWVQYFGGFRNGYNLTIGGMAPKIIGSDDIVAFVALWNNGRSASSIAKMTGHAPSTIISFLKSAGVYDEHRSRSAGRAKMKRAVSQYDMDGNLVMTYNSIAEASASSGISDKLISRSATRKRPSTKYQWRYADEAPPEKYVKPIRNHIKSKPICQYDLSNNLLHIYTSITEAAYVSGIEKSNICANCNGRKRSAGGYKWGYAL